MAQYKHLPIYKTTYELLNQIAMATRGFPKDFKYTLGSRLREECIELVLLIFRANSNISRRTVIMDALERVQVLELLLRLCKDMRLLSIKQLLWHFQAIQRLESSFAFSSTTSKA